MSHDSRLGSQRSRVRFSEDSKFIHKEKITIVIKNKEAKADKSNIILQGEGPSIF